ncbi:MAG: HD domain-containing protein, partial [Planctomycetales bacterium]|nr:HD domain-containing protein [Planctomycetales bacterium]
MIDTIPELNGAGLQLLRIPAEVDVPLTGRVVQILDTPSMQRLRRISQLGLVSYVYPGAVHTRFEHSLGVYRLACLTLRHLLANESVLASSTTTDEIKIFLLAALLHDIGHWPYCHAIEDLRLAEFPRHEELARTLICDSPLAVVIEREWSVEPARVAELIASTRDGGAEPSVLRSLLSGPVDIDKLDYLQRDSLHAGVPYG